MSLTSEQIEYYLDNVGVRCPWCQSSNLDAASELDQDGVTCYQNVRCAACNKEWIDKYVLVGISEVEEE
jgi:phage FluMu protein Com